MENKFLKNHKKRVEKVKNFTDKNKVFVVIMSILIVILIANAVTNTVKKYSENPPKTSVSDEQASEKKKEQQTEKWRFYPIDLWILGIGGGFCVCKILSERKKMKLDE
jgi:uncharacterized membrane protein